MRGYVLTGAALQDMRDIWNYTDRTWGRTQANRYANQLRRCFGEIASGRVTGRLLPEDHALRSVRCEHHYIFFQALPAQVVILAVLHEHMDMADQLKSRLDE